MILAIDIDSSLIRIGYSRAGDHLDEIVEISSPVSQRALMPLIIGSIQSLVGSTSIDAIGLASGGHVNIAKGTIIELTGTNWGHLRIAKPLQDAFGCKVHLAPTVLAGATAETYQRANKHNTLSLYLHLSRDISGCLVEDYEIPKYRILSEIGRLMISTSHASIMSWNDAWSDIDHTTHDWKQTVDVLSPGIHTIITTSSPDKIILGGNLSNYYKSFGKLLINELKQHDLRLLPTISSAKLGTSAPLVGAMYLAAQTLA